MRDGAVKVDEMKGLRREEGVRESIEGGEGEGIVGMRECNDMPTALVSNTKSNGMKKLTCNSSCPPSNPAPYAFS